jgi:hypothetical protein
VIAHRPPHLACLEVDLDGGLLSRGIGALGDQHAIQLVGRPERELREQLAVVARPEPVERAARRLRRHVRIVRRAASTLRE